ncbi:MAG: class I SAM-dependent methyltransferase [Roseitalea sp.]|nr:class I SAM-dependent methyltransferase [Roseitalea sp.]MBO6741472.1 class I SAM-dependent methyltransferase [Roseitalea sp.]
MVVEHFLDQEFVRKYVEKGPACFVPGFEALHRMTAILLAEHVPADGRLLLLGAGGGHELTRLASHQAGWRFCAVDPSEQMIGAARYRMDQQGDAERVDWVCGLIDDAPAGPFDGATCLLTLHFVPDDGGKLETLRSIRQRLQPGAPFVLVDLCTDRAAPGFDRAVHRYGQYAALTGAEPDDVEQTTGRIRQGHLNSVPPERNLDLFREAGFESIELFYAGLSWRGWIMRNPNGSAGAMARTTGVG